MTYLYRTRFILIAILVALAPFHAFLITWAGAPLLLSMWREFLVVVICALISLEMLISKRRPRFDLLDWMVLAYFAVAVCWFPLQTQNPAQWLLGVRFDVMPFLFLIFVRQVEWKNKEMLIKTFFVSAAVVVVFGLLQSLVLPKNFLTHFGYPVYDYASSTENTLTSCQYLERTSSVCRAVSTFGGPTRYGTYLLLVLGMLLPTVLEKARGKFLAAALFVLTIASIFFTYSRSVWIGLAGMVVFALFWLAYTKPGGHRRKIITAALCVLCLTTIAAGIFAWKFSLEDKNSYITQLAHSIFVRTSSSSAHVELAKKGLQTIAEHPLGIGLGKVGPASVRFGGNFLTENWYLQIGAEMGVIGLVLFLGILFLISRRLLMEKANRQKIGLFLSLFGIAVTGLFTHSFEETSTILILIILYRYSNSLITAKTSTAVLSPTVVSK